MHDKTLFFLYKTECKMYDSSHFYFLSVATYLYKMRRTTWQRAKYHFRTLWCAYFAPKSYSLIFWLRTTVVLTPFFFLNYLVTKRNGYYYYLFFFTSRDKQNTAPEAFLCGKNEFCFILDWRYQGIKKTAVPGVSLESIDIHLCHPFHLHQASSCSYLIQLTAKHLLSLFGK